MSKDPEKHRWRPGWWVAIERALQAAPEDTSVMDALGELLLGLGEAERAFEVGWLGA